MASRFSFAYSLGGPLLAQAILDARRRYRPRSYRTFGDLTDADELDVDDAEEIESEFADLDRFAGSSVSSVFTSPVSSLSKAEKMWIRVRFYDLLNLPKPRLLRWARDPRVRDGVDAKFRDTSATKAHLLRLGRLASDVRKDGSDWTNEDYEAARRSVFVVENLLHPSILDYRTWVLLRNFGYDWTRRFSKERRRTLPVHVQREASARLSQLKKPGRGFEALQL